MISDPAGFERYPADIGRKNHGMGYMELIIKPVQYVYISIFVGQHPFESMRRIFI